jgi:hypothetical protein
MMEVLMTMLSEVQRGGQADQSQYLEQLRRL